MQATKSVERPLEIRMHTIKRWVRNRAGLSTLFITMKQGPAENMTVAVLKQLLKDKGIAFISKAKKSDLVKIFNTQACTRHNNVTLSWLHVKRAPTVKVLAAVTVRNVTAYDGCFSKPKQFYFADKHPPNKIYNHVVDSCQRSC